MEKTYDYCDLTQIRENLLKTVPTNLKKIIDQHNISQKDFADQTGISAPALSGYLNGKNLPSAELLVALKTNFDISIDDFLTKSVNPEDYMPAQDNMSSADLKEREVALKYCGTYYTYYFDTSNYTGKDDNDAEESIKYGILHIYEHTEPYSKASYGGIAVLGIDNRDEADKIKSQIESKKDAKSILEYIGSNYSTSMYHGTFNLGENCVYLDLEHGDRDKALAIFHKVKSNKKLFRGGLGTINSVSKGREPMPTTQFIGLSRDKITLSAEEIQHALLLKYPNFRVIPEYERLISLIKKLYINDPQEGRELSDFQKSILIKADLEHYVRESLKNNIYRYSKISNNDDHEWYHLIKDDTETQNNKYE